MAINPTRIAAAAAMLLSTCPAVADDTGFSVLHALSREGGRICFLDHFHYGSSASVPTEHAARVSAIKSWADFVALEYGSDWARYSRARSKSMKCQGAGRSWGCQVEARPCK